MRSTWDMPARYEPSRHLPYTTGRETAHILRAACVAYYPLYAFHPVPSRNCSFPASARFPSGKLNKSLFYHRARVSIKKLNFSSPRRSRGETMSSSGWSLDHHEFIPGVGDSNENIQYYFLAAGKLLIAMVSPSEKKILRSQGSKSYSFEGI